MHASLKASLAAASVLCCLAGPALAAPKIGEQAPDFTLETSKGETVSLSQFRGTPVLLEWSNYECPFVKKHYDSGNMQELQKRYKEKGVTWLTVMSSAPGKHGYYEAAELDRLSAEKGVASAYVLRDADGKAGRAYGAKTTPHIYAIDKDGVLAYAGAIDSIPSTDASDIGKADNYAAAALDALLKGEKPAVAATQAYGCGVKY
jgi:peroxiredoxin